jgi:hypothetical protein
MELGDMKPFDPAEVDESLTRVVVHNGKTYLLFPYVNATKSEPQYNSIGFAIAGEAASVRDFHNLTSLLVKAAQGYLWRIVFNTPWMIGIPDENTGPQRIERK